MLTRPRRQVAATAALVFFTVAPTLYVGARIHRVGRPAHAREVEAEIGRRLGVLVKVDSASHPRPDVDVLSGVTLSLDDRADAEIARADSVRIRHDGAEMTLRVGHLAIRGSGASDALEHAILLIRRLASGEGSRLNLIVDRCDVRLGARMETLSDLAAVVQVDPAAPSVSASYLLADEAGKTRTRCEMSLRCEAGSTAVSLRTMEGSVPARVLAPFFSTSEWLGDSARLDGSLALTRGEAGAWDAEFRGDLLGIDLSRVVGRRFAGHRLSGMARLSVEIARWAERPDGQGPGWVEARGTLTAGPGAISAGLLSALQSRMRFRLARPIEPGPSDVEFQGLGIAFAMNAAGELNVKGALGGEYAPDAVLVQGHRAQPLAKAPEGVANVRGLWNALIPATPDALAPAVPEAQALRSLPLPGARSRGFSAN